MGRKYPTRFVNEIFALKEYQRGGISDRARVVNARNSRSTLVYTHEMLTCGRKLPLKHSIKNYSNYIRHSLHEELNLGSQRARIPSKAMFFCCLPIGYYLWRRDRRTFRKEDRRLQQRSAE
jgi:hypothetical protein